MSNSSYKEIKAQIVELEKQAELVRQNEIKDAIQFIHATMNDLGITIDDLGFNKNAAKNKRLKPAAPPKYRDPDTNKTWNGRGVEPKWLKGKRDQYLIQD